MKLFILLLIFTSNVWATESIPVIIPFAAGGATDQAWRAIHPKLNQELKKHRIRIDSEYLPGAGGGIGATAVFKKSQPALLFTSAALITAQLQNRNLDYDPTGFRLIGYAGYYPLMLFAGKTGPKNWQELTSKCARKPVTYGNSGLGSMTHLAAHQLLSVGGCVSIAVPYKSAVLSLPDLVIGDLDLVMDHATTNAWALVQQQRIRAILALAEKRSSQWPDVPTSKELALWVPFQNWQVLVSNLVLDSNTAVVIQKSFVLVLPEVRQELENLGLLDSGRSVAADFLREQHKHLSQYSQ